MQFLLSNKAFTINSYTEFEEWLKSVEGYDYTYEGEYLEGFVIEDQKGFMTKLKLDYYVFWKHLRTALANPLGTSRLILSKTNNYNLAKEFLDFLIERQTKGEIFDDIITARSHFKKNIVSKKIIKHR